MVLRLLTLNLELAPPLLPRTSSTTAYVKPPARGTHKYRWLLPAHADHTSGVSATTSVRVY